MNTYKVRSVTVHPFDEDEPKELIRGVRAESEELALDLERFSLQVDDYIVISAEIVE